MLYGTEMCPLAITHCNTENLGMEAKINLQVRGSQQLEGYSSIYLNLVPGLLQYRWEKVRCVEKIMPLFSPILKQPGCVEKIMQPVDEAIATIIIIIDAYQSDLPSVFLPPITDSLKHSSPWYVWYCWLSRYCSLLFLLCNLLGCLSILRMQL